MSDLNILFFFFKRKICKKTNKTKHDFFFYYNDTIWIKRDFPFKHEVSLVVCLILISRSVDVATFWSRYLEVFPFLSVSLGSQLCGNQQSLSSFLSVKYEMYWRNISGSPCAFHCDPHRHWQSPEQTRLFLNHRASHSYNMYIYSTCIEK